MKLKAQQLRSLLLADDGVSALVGQSVYWALGRQNEKQAAVIFSLSEILEGATADSRRYSCTLRCFAENMDVASDVYEAVFAAMTAAGHKFRGGSGGITDDEEREAALDVTFQLI